MFLGHLPVFYFLNQILLTQKNINHEMILYDFFFYSILTYPKHCKYNTRYFFFDWVAEYIGKNGYDIEPAI